jgi:hypothetical protein
MTDLKASDRDVSRAIRSWLHEDRHEDVSRVAGAVLDQVDTIPQRRATWWPVRRTPTMNKFLAIGLGAAAVVVALLVGAQLLGSPDGALNVGGDPTPTTSPESTPEPTPSPSADAGTPYVIADGQEANPEDAYPPLTVTLPAGWGIDSATGVVVGGTADAPNGAFVMTFAEREYWVYGDPCRWSTTRPDTPSTTVNELVTALSAQASRDASQPVDITVDGHAGKSITLHVPDDAAFEECDDGNFGYWASIDPEFGDDGVSPSRHAQAPGQIDTLYILDLDGVIMIIDTSSYPGTPAEDVAAMEAIVESGSFGD